MANLYVFIGQSNSRGAAPNADCHPSYLSALTQVQMWGGSSFANFDVGVNQSYPTPDAFHGAAPCFLYNEQARVGQTIYACMYAVGGTMLNNDSTSNCWYPSTGGTLTDLSISTINNALAYMWNTLKIRSYKLFFVWQQGESDTTADANANAYQANLTYLINKFNNNISGTVFSGIKKYWILVKISTGTDYDTTRRGTVNTAFDTVAAIDSALRYTLDPTGNLLQVDVHHFEASGYRNQGIQMVTGITTSNNL